MSSRDMSDNKLKTGGRLEPLKRFLAAMLAAIPGRYELLDLSQPVPAVELVADESQHPGAAVLAEIIKHNLPVSLEDEGRKPLFIPLKTEYFQAFQDGSKTEELRLYGPGWNEGTCFVGRAVVLSKGYGKQERLAGRISGFKKQAARSLAAGDRKAVRAIYETLDVDMAVIEITGLEPIAVRGQQEAWTVHRPRG